MNDVATKRGKDTTWRDALTREEIDDLLRLRDWRSWVSLATNWGLVLGSMALVAAWPNPLTVILALFVIGARQLGMAVLMHEASHRSLFSNRRLNDWAGQWLCAYPVWADVHSYRPYHLRHHARTWTKDDPDLKLATPFPITRESLWRKIWRDLSGQTGLKFARFSVRRDAGTLFERGERTFWGTPRLQGVLVTNGALLAVLALAGHPLLYLLWVGAWFTTYTLVTRFRAIAEHSMSPDPADPLRNTRTTLARWWERLFLAPNFVNYHLEHHLLVTVPHYNLPRMHRLLRERGVLDGALVSRGYPAVLRQAASSAAA